MRIIGHVRINRKTRGWREEGKGKNRHLHLQRTVAFPPESTDARTYSSHSSDVKKSFIARTIGSTCNTRKSRKGGMEPRSTHPPGSDDCDDGGGHGIESPDDDAPPFSSLVPPDRMPSNRDDDDDDDDDGDDGVSSSA